MAIKIGNPPISSALVLRDEPTQRQTKVRRLAPWLIATVINDIACGVWRPSATLLLVNLAIRAFSMRAIIQDPHPLRKKALIAIQIVAFAVLFASTKWGTIAAIALDLVSLGIHCAPHCAQYISRKNTSPEIDDDTMRRMVEEHAREFFNRNPEVLEEAYKALGVPEGKIGDRQDVQRRYDCIRNDVTEQYAEAKRTKNRVERFHCEFRFRYYDTAYATIMKSLSE